MTDHTRPARLELIVRRPGDAAASPARMVASADAFRGFKPTRVPEAEWELAEQPAAVDGRGRYVVRNIARDRYVLLGEPERVAWELMDGQHTVMEIAGALFVRFGAFDVAGLERLLAELRAADLLALARLTRLRATVARFEGRWWAQALHAILHALDHCTVRVPDVDGWLGRVHAAGAWVLTTRVAVIGALVLAGTAAGALFTVIPEVRRVGDDAWARPLTTLVLPWVVLLASIALHELAHALACKAYGRRVREFGFTLLHGFFPIFYADVTDIFMASRRARIVVSLAGPLANLTLGALAFLAAAVADGHVRAALILIGVLQWEMVAINVYPFTFVALDGYHVLVDCLGLPTLKTSAWRFVTGELCARARTRTSLRREEWIFVAYIGLSAVSVAVYSGVHARALLGWLLG